MTYLDHSEFSLAGSVEELSFAEIAAVVGGSGEDVAPGECTTCTYRSDGTRDATGNLLGYTCTPNEMEKKTRQEDRIYGTVKESLSETWKRLTGSDD